MAFHFYLSNYYFSQNVQGYFLCTVKKANQSNLFLKIELKENSKTGSISGSLSWKCHLRHSVKCQLLLQSFFKETSFPAVLSERGVGQASVKCTITNCIMVGRVFKCYDSRFRSSEKNL